MRDFTGEELKKCNKLLDTLDDDLLLKVTLGPFASFVMKRNKKIRLALTDRLGMNLGSYNIVDRGGGFIDTASAIGENAIYNAKTGEWVKTKKSKGNKGHKLKKYQINGNYFFNAARIKDGMFEGEFEFFTYLDSSRFKEVSSIQRGKEHHGEHIQFVSGRNWGAYVNGKFYRGLYSQPVKKGLRARTLVLNSKYARGELPPVKFLFESNVGDFKQSHKFFRPFVNSEEIVQEVVDKFYAWKSYEFAKSVKNRFKQLFDEVGK